MWSLKSYQATRPVVSNGWPKEVAVTIMPIQKKKKILTGELLLEFFQTLGVAFEAGRNKRRERIVLLTESCSEGAEFRPAETAII